MIKISRESEINLINILIDQDVISGKDLIDIKKKSYEGDKSQIDAVFELNLTDEDKILDLLIKEQSLEIIDLTTIQITDELKTILPSNYINMNFIAPFKIDLESSGTIFLSSKYFSTPIPSHSSQAPMGALKLNSLGSISSIENPDTGHANFEEKVVIFLESKFSR